MHSRYLLLSSSERIISRLSPISCLTWYAYAEIYRISAYAYQVFVEESDVFDVLASLIYRVSPCYRLHASSPLLEQIKTWNQKDCEGIPWVLLNTPLKSCWFSNPYETTLQPVLSKSTPFTVMEYSLNCEYCRFNTLR